MKEGENLVAVANEYAKVEARKLKEESAIASRLLSEVREELLKQKAFIENVTPQNPGVR